MIDNPIIHIGYHKTASTFLQQSVFPFLGINYIFLDNKPILEMLRSEVVKEPLKINKIIEDISNKHSKNKSSITLISQESLSGHPNGYFNQEGIIAENLKSIFPNAKIIIVIRNQIDYLLSMYCYRVVNKGNEYRSLQSYIKQEFEKGLLKKFEYDHLYENYQKLFGKENILLIQFEEVKKSPQQFINILSEFIINKTVSIKSNKTINKSTRSIPIIMLWRPINFLFNIFFNRLLFRFVSHKTSSLIRYGFHQFKLKTTSYLKQFIKYTKSFDRDSVILSDDIIKKIKTSNSRLESLSGIKLDEKSYLL